MSIRITGMYSGLDTESIISELVSAQSVKKSSMVKAQTKLSWKQDAWKALNTKIFSFYTNTLSNMRFQSSYMKKTTKVSNSNAINVVTGADAVDGVRTVSVNKLAKGGYLTGADLTGKGDVGYTGGASLASLLKHSKLNDGSTLSNDSTLSGSFDVVGADGSSYTINVNSNTTINDVVSQLQKAGLNANYDQDSQRIFVSSKNTGEYYNFSLVGNNEGGMNALAVLGLLSTNDLNSSEYTKWAGYNYSSGEGKDVYDKLLKDKVAAYKAEWDSLTASTKAINDSIAALKDNDEIGSKFSADNSGAKLSDIYNDLYKEGGLYDVMKEKKAAYDTAKVAYEPIEKAEAAYNAAKEAAEKAEEAYNTGKDNGTLTEADKEHLKKTWEDAQKASEDAQKAYEDAKAKVGDDDAVTAVKTAYEDAKTDYETAKTAYDDKKAVVDDYLDEIRNGKLVEKKDEESNTVYEQAKNDDGTLKFESDGTTPVYDTSKPVMVRDGNGLMNQWNKYQADGTLPAGVANKDELLAQINSYNKWLNAFEGAEANTNTLASNKARLEEIEKNITVTPDKDKDGNDITVATATTALENDMKAYFDAKVANAKSVFETDEAGNLKTDADGNPIYNKNGKYAALAGGTKIDGQDAEIILNGAKFTSSTNTFTVNGLTLTAQEVTSSEVTLTTATDTDGIYDMIKNFFSEYNKLINEMDSLYNAESSKGYDPLTAEEKDALSDTEVEEWEKKIKDSLLRRDSTLRTVSDSMVSILLQGTKVNGKQMYLSDFGINTLGYFKSKDNERNAYHIDGDADDVDTKSNEDKLKKMIASDPETVMNFFSQLSTSMYDNLTEKMSSIKDTRSAFTVYNDKVMKKEYDAYTDKIKAEEEKLNNMMDKWYSKFSKMETALAKLESKNSSLSSLFGN
ncbi:MAG: flagellar filament capping protein FliD [Lachnospiraceae bacterium]|nr:flagellar filament capping protein FliD [Lachnospiraceae bacterium]